MTSAEGDDVKGKRVQVFLRTPLFRGRYEGGEKLQRGVVEVLGTVVAETRTGIHVKVEALRDERGEDESALPFAEIIVPPGKIDYLVLCKKK